MEIDLTYKRVAILATDGFDQAELLDPQEALEMAGGITTIVSLGGDTIRGWHNGDWGDEVPVDVEIEAAQANDYDALVLPGGVLSLDDMRVDSRVVNFVKTFFETAKPVAALCHGLWLLVEADVMAGRQVTSCASLKTDIENAGGKWLDRRVVEDRGLVTLSKPDFIEQFNQVMLETIYNGVHG